MRAWEPEPGEQRRKGKPWHAFKLYRDLGPGRTHKAVAAMIYGPGVKHGLRTVEGWSSEFDWVERIKGMEARDEMVVREAMERRAANRAEEYAERQERLRFKNLENAEKAADQEAQMLNAPLHEQVLVKPADNGEMAVFHIMPAAWTKNTVKAFHDVASKGAGEPERTEISGEIHVHGEPEGEAAEVRDIDRRVAELREAISRTEGGTQGEV